MTAQSPSLDTPSLDNIQDFLAQKRIAIIGLSREPKDLSALLFNELCRRGYDVVPVNPNAPELLGHRCFARIQDVQPPVEAALLMTSPEVTETVAGDCAEAGIHRIWMFRGGGRGSVSDKAVQFCRARGIQVIPGECPFMFLPKSGTVHRLHGFLCKITGSYPKHAHVAKETAHWGSRS